MSPQQICFVLFLLCDIGISCEIDREIHQLGDDFFYKMCLFDHVFFVQVKVVTTNREDTLMEWPRTLRILLEWRINSGSVQNELSIRQF